MPRRGSRRDFVDLYVAATTYGLREIVDWFATKYAAVSYSRAHLVSVDVRKAVLLDALATLLAGADYVVQYSSKNAGSDRVSVWVHGPSNPTAATCRDTPGPGGGALEAAAPTIATDRLPTGPSPAEAEAARLHATGMFSVYLRLQGHVPPASQRP